MELLAPQRQVMNKKYFSQTGQSLIEIVVAVGIIAVVLVGVSDLITRSLSLASFQAGKNEAVNIAQSQLNNYRQKKDENPDLFFDSGLGNPASGFSSCTTGSSKYVCAISYTNTNPENTKTDMKVSVTWQNGSNTIVTELSQTLVKPPK